MLRVAVIYHIWPHYRRAVAEAMDGSGRIAYTFFGSGESLRGVKHADIALFKRFKRAPFRRLGPLLWQPAAISAALSRDYDALVMLGDPYFVSTWAAAAIARLRGIPVLFWTHGWLREERGLKKMMRSAFFRLANRLLVYAERGKRIGIAAGYPADRITVIYNSLDVDQADDIVTRIETGALDELRPQALFADPRRPLVICTARLTPQCRFDLLLEAAKRLADRGSPINILLVGEGPERRRLEKMAADAKLAVHFFGACYDEEVLGQLIYHADLTVSPGKIGLTAMHSLMYGAPAITHDDLDGQMPEVEALTAGKTGAFFKRGDVASLADAIAGWLEGATDRQAIRSACRAVVHDKWNPHVQAMLIEGDVTRLASRA